MSRPTETHPPRDAGFSLVEVIVAIGIFAVLVVAVLPQLIVGIKSNDAARRSTQAKSIALAELERMRNLPFHVSPTAGDFIDVFDRYFHDLTAPASSPVCTDGDGAFVALTTQSSGYVAPGSPRCAWEPTGALYRQIRSGSTDPDLAGFVLVVDTQFLSDVTPPAVVTPPTGYDTQVVGRDAPAAAQIGVTVTVLPLDRGVRTPLSTYTRISRHHQAATRITSRVDVTALDVGTATASDVPAIPDIPLSLSAGLLKLAGSLTSTTRLDAVLSAASASLGTGEQASGAASATSAPPSQSNAPVDVGDGELESSDCLLACWGATHLSPVAINTINGLVNAGSPSSPLEAIVNGPSEDVRTLRLAAGAGASYRESLDLTAPLIDLTPGAVGSATSAGCTVLTTGTNVRVAASGWIRSTAPSAPSAAGLVEACATARTSPIAVLPTSFAPDGVLRVQLVRASARCAVSGAAHAATTSYDFLARVERWTPAGYVLVTSVVPGAGPDPLATVDLSTTAVGTHGFLGDWIESWSAVTEDEIRQVATGGVSSLAIPGIVNIVTQPLRNRLDAEGNVVLDEFDQAVPEDQSTLSLSLGTIECTAEDSR